ncbi:hypothetical protein [Roseibium aestuarii]|uniref:Uncharacterized protein n=1 Tax=Roseibium aestuarii TaxID=2600299 RepID=A0ABW4JYU6_9HYPH|nr:hypothetical protein [Roseibium aestuarii]
MATNSHVMKAGLVPAFFMEAGLMGRVQAVPEREPAVLLPNCNEERVPSAGVEKNACDRCGNQ